VTAIDVHCHVMPLTLPDNPGADGRWPCVHCHGPTEASLMIDGKPFRKVDDRSWSPRRRMDDMDRDGIALQVLSPMPELLSYWFTAGEAGTLCDHVNGALAEMVAQAPGRFAGLGMVPLQDPVAAVAALERLSERFGLLGIEIGSNINGVQLGDARFEPVWQACAELGLAVFVHALHPVSAKAAGADPLTTAFVHFPLDVAMAASSLILAGVPARYPGLRLGFSHGGGGLGAMVGRLDRGWSMTDGFNGKLVERPSTHAARLFYDSNVYDPAFVRHLVRELAPGQVFLGGDYPYPLMQADLVGYMDSCGLTNDERHSLAEGAARRFLNL
jgi:aminocarboxymuconate-semialdehyde decarboxylase